jgi:cytochrome P450
MLAALESDLVLSNIPHKSNANSLFITRSAIIFLLSVLTYPTLIRMLPIEKNRQIREGVRMVNKCLKDLISQRKKDMMMNVDNLNYLDNTGHRDIISSAMKTNAFTTENLVDQSKTLLGAGHET